MDTNIAPYIMDEAKRRILHLPFRVINPSLQLLVDFVSHSQSGRREGMTKALQATIGIDWLLTFKKIPASLNILGCPTARAKSQILNSDKLSRAETIV